MTGIVRTAYRYKLPPRKRKPVALEVPAVITAASKRRRASDEAKAALAASLELAPGERKPAAVPPDRRTLHMRRPDRQWQRGSVWVARVGQEGRRPVEKHDEIELEA
jgi:hypothetical protein